MNWLLVILVSSTPVKTDLIFQDFNNCMKKELEVREIHVGKFNNVKKWVDSSNLTDKEKKEILSFSKSQMVSGTCIPTTSTVTVN